MPKTSSSDGPPIATFEFDFETRTPTGALAKYVESIWYARGTIPYAREKIAPTGSTVGIFVLGDPIIVAANNGLGGTLETSTGFLLGPHDGPVINEPTGETFAVGIVTTPTGCETVFGVRPNTIRSGVVDLLQTWPVAKSIRNRIRGANSKHDMLDLVEASIEPRSVPGVERCAHAVNLLIENPLMSITEVATCAGLSHGHLDREFSRVIGLTPRRLSRLLRVRRLLAELDITRDADWSALANEYGWFDQAHFIRDFKRHTGVTPNQYMRAQREVYTPVEPGDAAGFVPEVDVNSVQ